MSELTRLNRVEELEACLERSWREPVWVFKHSLTCSISFTALAEFEAFVDEGGPARSYALIEVQTARELSDELARRTGVLHESPQVILLRDGEAVWHASHWRIEAESLQRASAAMA
jgi:bacillithiol system protein YtxJ